MRIEIENVKIEGRRRFEFIERSGFLYQEQRTELNHEFNMNMPIGTELWKFGKRRDLRVLCAGVLIDVVDEKGCFYQFEFLPGFITDFASVPWFFRSLIDNDDERIIAAALIHGFLFSTHGLPFWMTNQMFRQVAISQGYPRIKARMAFIAVNSIPARHIWNDTTDRSPWSRQRAQMLIPRPFDYRGKVYDSLPLLEAGHA